MDILHQVNDHGTKAAVGHHDGLDLMPDQMLFEKEKEILQQLSPRKRSEWLASRELLYRIAGSHERVECLYDEFGKPYLHGSPKEISVSHSGPWCAAMVSDQPCGVDIQLYSHTVERIVHKFLSPEEMEVRGPLQSRWHQLHLLWGAKECMYKAYGKKKLEFRLHIFVRDYIPSQHKALGEITYEGVQHHYDIYYRMLPETAWVYCVERK